MQSFKHTVKTLVPERFYAPLLSPYHWLRALLANIKYGFPARELKVVAVTGTNGKTTVAALIASVLEANGATVGLSSTALFKIGKDQWDNDRNMTVTDPFELQALLARMKQAQVDWVVLEVTSHALAQHRVWGVPIHTAVFTNLAPDHLDYHGSMEKYAEAKAKLIKMAKNEVVLNRDDDWFDFFARRSSKAHYTYGTNLECDVRLLKAELKVGSSLLRMSYGQDELEVRTSLTGKFNAYNVLAAAATALGLQIKPADVKKGLEGFAGVPGRMEAIEAGQPFRVMVDYAHMPEAFEALFENLGRLSKGRLIAVFGGAGDRDPGRWPGMGDAAGRLANIAIVTDDEPHSENPAKIRQVILAAAQTAGQAKVIEEPDRTKAITLAFKMAQPGDNVLLLCLGHQKYRIVGNKKLPWDDRHVARDILKEMFKK